MNMQYTRQLNDAVETLLNRVPEFAIARAQDSSFMSHGNDDIPYLVFGDFGLFLRQYLAAGRGRLEDESIVQSGFGLLDEMLTSNDAELMNLVQIGVFEGLANTPELLAIAKDYLSDEAKSVLEVWLGKWLAWANESEEQQLQ